MERAKLRFFRESRRYSQSARIFHLNPLSMICSGVSGKRQGSKERAYFFRVIRLLKYERMDIENVFLQRWYYRHPMLRLKPLLHSGYLKTIFYNITSLHGWIFLSSSSAFNVLFQTILWICMNKSIFVRKSLHIQRGVVHLGNKKILVQRATKKKISSVVFRAWIYFIRLREVMDFV